MKNILVFNVNWIGDCVFSSAVFSNLKRAFPDAKVSCLAVNRVRDILDLIPEIDEIIVYDEQGVHKNFLGKLKLVRDLRKSKFDAVYLLHRSFSRALLMFLAGIPKRVGYDEKRRGPLLTHSAPPPREDVHRMDAYLGVLEIDDVPIVDRTCRLDPDRLSGDARELFREKTGPVEGKKTVMVHPGGNWELKRWPVAQWVEFVTALQDDGHHVVITGGDEERKLAERIAKQCPRKPQVLAGELSLKEFMALAAQASLMISADSGPLHIASALGTPVVGIFGPTRPEVTGPRGRTKAVICHHEVGCNSRPCYHLACPDNICMQSVTANEVKHAARSLKDS